MIVSHILDQKGRDVATIAPASTMADVVAVLGTRRFGALVVAEADKKILGIVSERDVVKVLAREGAGILQDPVSKHMTSKVITCAADDTIETVMQAMTNGRFRHMPVARGHILDGIISIGDVVKARIEQMASESQALREYINS
ncbi:MAG: CBS domain-containing protein [Proteobacteria bacterium]|nr:CBS domain-containing protein [Pseudomonadota bacterium]